MPQKERESARVERINEQHKHEWLNSGGRGGRRLLKRRERWKTDTILLSRSEPGSTSPWPWLIHMDGPVTERRGWRTVKNGLMWGCTATGVHMAPEAPTRSHDKGGSALKSCPPQTSLGILFRSPPFPLQSLSLFCQPSKQQRNVPSANQHSLGDCLYTCWLVIIVMADAKNVVQLSRLMCYVNICGIWGSADVHRDVCRVSSIAQRLSSRAFATIVSSMAINQVAWRAFMMSAFPHLTSSSKSQTRDFPNIKSDL